MKEKLFRKNDRSGYSAFKKTVFVAILLAFLTPLRPLLVLFLGVLAIAYVLRVSYRTCRPVGLVLTGLLTVSISWFAFLQYSVYQECNALQNELAAYSIATIRCEYFPLPHVPQLSISSSVSDEQLLAILSLNGLENITELYLKSDYLSDASLDLVAAKLRLEYIFIDSDNISDNAILSFERRFPECQVIAYKRKLHDNGIDVFLGPQKDGR